MPSASVSEATTSTVWLTLGGQSLQLLPQRALWWPAQRRLLVADVHLGKDQLFRQRGIGVPEGAVNSDLQRLQSLLQAFPSAILTVLGDLVHARPRSTDRWVLQLHDWLTQIGPARVEVVLGNHDRHMANLLEQWQIAHHARLDVAGLQLRHAPDELSAAGIAGHLHPGTRLRAAGQSLRLPVFWQRGEQLVLPAFGRFTGLMDVRRADCHHAGQRLFVVQDELAVLALPDGERA